MNKVVKEFNSKTKNALFDDRKDNFKDILIHILKNGYYALFGYNDNHKFGHIVTIIYYDERSDSLVINDSADSTLIGSSSCPIIKNNRIIFKELIDFKEDWRIYFIYSINFSQITLSQQDKLIQLDEVDKAKADTEVKTKDYEEELILKSQLYEAEDVKADLEEEAEQAQIEIEEVEQAQIEIKEIELAEVELTELAEEKISTKYDKLLREKKQILKKVQIKIVETQSLINEIQVRLDLLSKKALTRTQAAAIREKQAIIVTKRQTKEPQKQTKEPQKQTKEPQKQTKEPQKQIQTEEEVQRQEAQRQTEEVQRQTKEAQRKPEDAQIKYGMNYIVEKSKEIHNFVKKNNLKKFKIKNNIDDSLFKNSLLVTVKSHLLELKKMFIYFLKDKINIKQIETNYQIIEMYTYLLELENNLYVKFELLNNKHCYFPKLDNLLDLVDTVLTEVILDINTDKNLLNYLELHQNIKYYLKYLNNVINFEKLNETIVKLENLEIDKTKIKEKIENLTEMEKNINKKILKYYKQHKLLKLYTSEFLSSLFTSTNI
jgi:hypothetical protein